MTGRNFPWVTLAAALACLWLPSAPAAAEPEIKYPIVFNSMSELQRLGISLDWPPLDDEQIRASPVLKAPALPNGCYWYAGYLTHYLYSVSDEFLAGYTAKGFSRESLCMGLVSDTRFDPETGERLPTYIFRDDAALQSHLSGLDPSRLSRKTLAEFVPGTFASKQAMKKAIAAMRRGDRSSLNGEQLEVLVPGWYFTEEQPLKLPDCFKNGIPLLDCDWRYDRRTGEKLPDDQRVLHRKLGEALDQQIQEAIARGGGELPYSQEDISKAGGYLLIDRHIYDAQEAGSEPYRFAIYLTLTGELQTFRFDNDVIVINCYAASPALPRGYGYLLDAVVEGFGDAGLSAESILAAFDAGHQSSLLTSAQLKKILEE